MDFAFSKDRVTLARLNELGETVELAPRELAVALLCDGTTTLREADAFLQASGGGSGAARVLSRLEQANLTVPAMNEQNMLS